MLRVVGRSASAVRGAKGTTCCSYTTFSSNRSELRLGSSLPRAYARTKPMERSLCSYNVVYKITPQNQQHFRHLTRWNSNMGSTKSPISADSRKKSDPVVSQGPDPFGNPRGSTNDTKQSSTIPTMSTGTINRIEHRVKKIVDDSDLLPILCISLVTAILISAPFASRYMKEQAAYHDGYDDRLQTDDPVDEFAKLARREWNMSDNPDFSTVDDSGNQNIVEFILKDLMKSTALQQVAQDFVLQILQSERFKEAVSRLVKELWSDLVTDPETVAQVVKLLEIVIQSPLIKEAVIELVLQIAIREPEIQKAILDMIEGFAQDDLVREATVNLLTDAAHATLNDPDLLDHSMEFATDVVGDDIVQKTAGEALRKSVEHAVKPATTVLLTTLGIGFLICGVVAVGYSRSSEQEAVLFKSAALSLHSNATAGIMRILTWPLRAIQSAFDRSSSVFWSSVVAFETSSITRQEMVNAVGESLSYSLHYVVDNCMVVYLTSVTATSEWVRTYNDQAISLRSVGIVAVGAIRDMSYAAWTSARLLGSACVEGCYTFGNHSWRAIARLGSILRDRCRHGCGLKPHFD